MRFRDLKPGDLLPMEKHQVREDIAADSPWWSPDPHCLALVLAVLDYNALILINNKLLWTWAQWVEVK